jgi:hypothetical protein
MKSRFARVSAAYLTCLILAACAAEIGLRPAADVQFVIGKTTKAEVIKELGLPQEITRDPAGTEHYWYEPSARLTGLCIACGFPSGTPDLLNAAVVHASAERAKRDRAQMTFDASGVLAEYTPSPRKAGR